MKLLNQLKKGELFCFPNKTIVYVFTGYNRFTKKYGYHKYYDINSWYEKKGPTQVCVDFPFEF